MKSYRIMIFLSMASCCMAICHAQKIDSSKARAELDNFINFMTSDFDNFRIQTMSEFNEFVRNPWKEFKEEAPIPKPKEEPVPPVVMPIEDQTKPIPIKPDPIVIEEVIKPIVIVPQPQPIEPITPVVTPDIKEVTVSLFGTPITVKYSPKGIPSVGAVNETNVANALEKLAVEENDNLIASCLEARKKYDLSDWGYLYLLRQVSREVTSTDNDAELLMAYLFMQSGYKMRMASDHDRLYMLFGTQHIIFDTNYYRMDDGLYYGVDKLPNKLYICQASFPGEKPMSLIVPVPQKLAYDPGTKRSLQASRYSEAKASVAVNRNLLAFYETFPTSMVNEDMMTRWAIYANTPMDDNVAATLYPALKEAIGEKDLRNAVGMLLNFVQTAFQYEYDDKVWGHDRAFFAEESLYYPYCDCEDRAILFTRLVRDLLGRDCLLVYYPGHLAAAVDLGDVEAGDWLELGGKRYTIADPTYIGAPVGCTMPKMDNRSAKVIQLRVAP